jgi:hypothetical protein
MRRMAAIACWLACASVLGGEPWRRHTIDGSSRGADGVRLADVDGDGRLDIATGWEEGGVIRVYRNPGEARVREPWPAVTVGRVPSPEDAVLVDLDGDAALDVVSSSEGSRRTIQFHWSPRDASQRDDERSWSTVSVPATAAQQMWMYAAPADLDGRNGVDLVVGSKGQEATISWLESPLNPRDVGEWRLHPLRSAGWIMSLVPFDLDRDGDLDIVYSDRKGERRGVGWLQNPGLESGRAGMPWRDDRIGAADYEVMFLTIADWNGDGVPDMVVATSRGPLVALVAPAGAGGWTATEIPLPPGCGTGKSVAAGDVDRDGVLDLVFTCEQARGDLSGVRWLRRDPLAAAGWRDLEISGPRGVKYDRVELLDLDDDGDLDVLTCEEADNLGVIWYENPRSAPRR